MDILLLILSVTCMVIGIAGSFLPVLPGPPLSYAGLLLLHFSKYASFSTSFLVIYGIITVLILVADLWMPAGTAKRYGASRYGTWGASIGVVAGIFLLPPFGLIIFPFLGAFSGELLSGKSSRDSLKAAWGSFLGFVLGIIIKLSLCLVMAFHLSKALLEYF